MNSSTAEFSDTKLVFKVRLNTEIKKIVIHNDEINYNELLLMMQRIFADKIKTQDEFTVKYTDEENDLITLSNDSDVALALQNSQKSLKLTLFLKDDENKQADEDIKPVEVFKELANIRSSIDKFLDKFDKYLKLESNIHKLEDLAKKTAESAAIVKSLEASSNSVGNELHKEFDPLNRRATGGSDSGHDLASRFQKNSRAQTPDSITEFSDGQKRVNGVQNKVADSTTNAFHQQQQQQQPQPLINSVSSSSIQPSHSNASLADHQHHIHQQQQQNQIQHHQQNHQVHQPFHPQFNGQAHQQQPIQQQQQQQQQPIQQQQQQQQPPQAPNPYFANPVAMKPGMPASNIPQQQPQHPALSPPGQAPFLPPLGTANPQMSLQQQYLPPGGAADTSHHQFYQQMPQQQNQFHQQQQQQPQQQQQQHQQQQNPALLQAQHQQQLNQQSPSNPVFPPNLMMNPASNPYSQKSGSLAAANRPPSATYQPGYK